MSRIKVSKVEINIISHNNDDYICLTDMAKEKEGDSRAADIIKNWIRNRSTIEFLGVWEQLNNPSFKVVEFDHFKQSAGLPTFVLSPSQWVEKTGAIGLYSKSGKYGGTYAHKDIAFEFGSAISPIFKLYLIKEFQRLKEKEQKLLNPEWDYRRFLSKVNYRLHTDSIKQNIIPKHQNLNREQENYIYANEAEMLNFVVFGMTSKQWREDNAHLVLKGYNMRDLASIPQLTVLSNLENINAHLIRQGVSPKIRLENLKTEATTQLTSISAYNYTYPIESPVKLKYEQSSTMDKELNGDQLNIPPKQ